MCSHNPIIFQIVPPPVYKLPSGFPGAVCTEIVPSAIDLAPMGENIAVGIKVIPGVFNLFPAAGRIAAGFIHIPPASGILDPPAVTACTADGPFIDIVVIGIIGPFACPVIVPGDSSYPEGVVTFPGKIIFKIKEFSCGFFCDNRPAVAVETDFIAFRPIQLFPDCFISVPFQVFRPGQASGNLIQLDLKFHPASAVIEPGPFERGSFSGDGKVAFGCVGKAVSVFGIKFHHNNRLIAQYPDVCIVGIFGAFYGKFCTGGGCSHASRFISGGRDGTAGDFYGHLFNPGFCCFCRDKTAPGQPCSQQKTKYLLFHILPSLQVL